MAASHAEAHGFLPEMASATGTVMARSVALGSRIAVAVVDENSIYRLGLVACLRADPIMDVAYESSSGPVPMPVDVIVVSKGEMMRHPTPGPIVVCCDNPRSVHTMAGQEVTLLPRNKVTASQLVAAVRAAASGLRVAARLQEPVPAARGGVSQRSVDALRLLAAGCGTREIAVALGYSERTVKTVISDMKLHLGAATQAQLVAEAIRLGLI